MYGVYPGMFEQSILVRQQTSKPWSVALSLAAELAGIGLLIVLPLVWTQNLPGLTPTKIGVWLAPTHNETPPQPVQHPLRAPVRPSPFGMVYIPHPLPVHPVEFRDPPPDVGGPVGDSGTSIPGMLLSQFSPSAPRPPEPPPVIRPVKVTPFTPGVIRVSHLDPAKLLYKVIPEYPEIAKRTRTQGMVRLIGVVATDGSIRSLQVVSGHPFLVTAAVEAVRQWRYQPTVLNGQPVEVEAPIEVTFTLQ
jgi:protein TonB